METLQVTRENAVKAFNAADKKGKELLTHLFGKEIIPGKIQDRIKTFEDAVNELGTYVSVGGRFRWNLGEG